jgi:hypothetical protein
VIVEKYIKELKEKQSELARAGMERPALDAASHGQNTLLAGKWQGIQIAIDTLENLLNESEES